MQERNTYMNLQYMRYALAVGRFGSISKAAEYLNVAQPNLSRSLKDLERGIGITIFRRSPRGMVTTPEGEEFLIKAAHILKQIEELDNKYGINDDRKCIFSITLQQAAYITEAFAAFTNKLGIRSDMLLYNETNFAQIIEGVTSGEYRLGVIRYEKHYEDHFSRLFSEKKLKSKLIGEYSFIVAVSNKSSLTTLKPLNTSALESFVEIVDSENSANLLSMSEFTGPDISSGIDKSLFVKEFGSRLEILSQNPLTYMWTTPLPENVLNRYGLAEIPCTDHNIRYCDVLIYSSDYTLSELDKLFIDEVKKSSCVLR